MLLKGRTGKWFCAEHRPADEGGLDSQLPLLIEPLCFMASQKPCLRARIDDRVWLWRIDRVVRREEVGVTLRGWHEHSLRNIRLRQLRTAAPRIFDHLPICHDSILAAPSAERGNPCAHRLPSLGARARVVQDPRQAPGAGA